MKNDGKSKLTPLKTAGKIKLNKPVNFGSPCYGTRGFNIDYCSDCKKCYIEAIYRGR
jgi:hypothetical protein